MVMAISVIGMLRVDEKPLPMHDTTYAGSGKTGRCCDESVTISRTPYDYSG